MTNPHILLSVLIFFAMTWGLCTIRKRVMLMIEIWKTHPTEEIQLSEKIVFLIALLQSAFLTLCIIMCARCIVQQLM